MATVGSGAVTRWGVASGITGAGGRNSSGTTAAALSTAPTLATAASASSAASAASSTSRVDDIMCSRDDVGRSLVFCDDQADLRETRTALVSMERGGGEAVWTAGEVSVHRVNVCPSQGALWRIGTIPG